MRRLGHESSSRLRPGLVAPGRLRRQENSLSDHYLGGRDIGLGVLVLTLFATQYSGNALLGYPGEAYRLGFAWVMTIGFMMAIVVVYLLFAPCLHRLAKHRGYVTPGDWVDHRFGSKRFARGPTCAARMEMARSAPSVSSSAIVWARPLARRTAVARAKGDRSSLGSSSM